MSGPLTFAYDGNFRFDTEDPAWRSFFTSHGVEPVRYDDMAELTQALRGSIQTVAYLPAANYFYVRDIGDYEPVASAVYAAENSTSLTSVLIVRADAGVNDVEQLRGGSYGYVHKYCTTSYFAPAILVHEHDATLQSFFGRLVQVAAYEAQVEAVLAGEVDCTMVQEDVWLKHPEYAKTTRVIAREASLPTPLVIVDRHADAALRSDLDELVLGHRPPITGDTLFAGFVAFERDQVSRFYAAAERALPVATAR